MENGKAKQKIQIVNGRNGGYHMSLLFCANSNPKFTRSTKTATVEGSTPL